MGKRLVQIKKKVAAYARVSTDYEDQINSYRVQCEEYTKVIKSNPDYIFVGIYADQGLSGTQAKKRPEFMKMLKIYIMMKFNVWKLQRKKISLR
jgi:site-specific DNA recombinase